MDKKISLIEEEDDNQNVVSTSKKEHETKLIKDSDILNEDAYKDPLTFLKTIDLADESDENKCKCVMNTSKILNDKVTYYTCSCFGCPELGDNICYDCLLNCHAEHLGDAKRVKEKTVKITEIYCSCAEHGHKKKEIRKRRSSTVTGMHLGDKCIISEILLSSMNLQSTFYQSKKNERDYICAFCFKNCIETPGGIKGYKIVDQSELPKDFKCKCKTQKNHSSQGNMNCIQKLLLDNELREEINAYQFPGTMFRCKKISKSLFHHFIETHSNIYTLISKGRLGEHDTSSIITENYLNSLRLLTAVSLRINLGNTYDFTIKDPQILGSFDIKFLEAIFKIQEDSNASRSISRSNNKNNHSLSKKSSDQSFIKDNDSYLLPTKTESLYFYRVFVMLPSTRIYQKFGVETTARNVTPLIRLINKKEYNEFVDILGVAPGTFNELLINIYKTIEKYNEHLLEYNIDEKKLMELATEYLDWLVIMAGLKYENDDYRTVMEGIVLPNFNGVLQIAKKYKSETKKIKMKVEQFAGVLFLMNNDEIFYNNVIKNALNDKPYNDSNAAFSNQTKSNYQQLNEEEENAPVDFQSELTFAFEPGDIQSMLINSLFAYKRDVKDATPEFQNQEIYDWLASPEDFYIESIRSYGESENNIDNKENPKLSNNQFIELMKPIAKIKESNFGNKLDVIMKIKALLTEIEQLKNNYAYGMTSSLTLYEDVYRKLVELNDTINANFNINRMTPEEKLTFKFLQLYLFKYGLFDSIFTIYTLFENNSFIINKISTKCYESLFDIIFDIFYKLCYNNQLLLNIFFTHNALENIFTINNQFSDIKFRYKVYECEFYLKLIKNIQSLNLKMNLSYFVELLFPIFDALRNLICVSKKSSILAGQSKRNMPSSKGKFSKMNALRGSSKNIMEMKSTLRFADFMGAVDAKDTIQNYTSDYLLTQITTINNCLRKCCSLSTTKSVQKTNNLILDIINEGLKSNYFYQIWEKYKRSFNDESGLIEGDSANVTHDNQQIMTNSGDLIKHTGTIINMHGPLTDVEKRCILSSYKLVSKLDDYSFYIITDNIQKYDLKYLLEEKMNIMEPYDRRILSIIYSRYYVTSPFNILTKLYYSKLETMTKLADTNLNGKVVAVTKEEVQPQKFDYKRQETGGLFGATKVINVDPNLLDDEKKNKEKLNPNNFFSGRAAFSFLKILRISELSLGLDPIFMNLSKYKRLMKLYMNTYFSQNPKMFVKYFKDVILFPSIFGVYKILYFTPTLNAKYKYLAYKMIYLFLECLKYFLETALNDPANFMRDEGYQKMLYDLFINERPDKQDMKEAMKQIKEKLNVDVPKIGKDPKFEPLKTKILLEYLYKYLKVLKPMEFLPLVLHGMEASGPIDDEEDKLDKRNSNQGNANELNLSEFGRKVIEFSSDYEEKKNESLDSGKNILISLFSEKITEDDTDKLQLKKNIAIDILFRIDFVKPKNQDYARGKDDMFDLLNIINKIYKADPDLWHSVIVEITFHTKQILSSIIREQLTYLIQFINIDYHKISIEKTNEDSNAIKRFLILLEYLRLHCENHHKIFQTILTNFNIIRRNPMLPGNQDGIDLLNFILKIPVMAMNSINYSQSRHELVSLFRKENKSFYNSTLTGITNYLIEIIQGSFEKNMMHFALSEELKETESEASEEEEENSNRNNGNEVASCNKDFDDYIEAGYLGFDNLGSDENEFFLSEFFRFIICLFEESLNPAENKEVLVKKFNPKKLFLGLSQCNQKLYEKYEKNANGKNNQSDMVPENFSKKLKDLYISNDEFREDLYFQLARNIFRYFLLATQYRSGEKIRAYLKELKEECEKNKPIPDKNKAYVISKREVYKFFTEIVKEVEIYYKPKETMSELERKKFKDFFTPEGFDESETNFKDLAELKGDVQKVVYFIHPDSLFVEDNDVIAFMENAPVEKNEKLNYLINYIGNFKNGIQMRKRLYDRQNKLLNLLYKINYNYACYISIFLAVVVNILILLSSFYEDGDVEKLGGETKNTLGADFNETIRADDEEDDEEERRRRYLLQELPDYSDNYKHYVNYNLPKVKNSFGFISFLEEETNSTNDVDSNEIEEDKGNATKTKSNTDETPVPATAVKEAGDESTASASTDEAQEENEEKTEPVVWIRKELNQTTIFALTLLNIIFIVFIMANWFYFNSLKDEIIQEKEETSGKKDNKKSSGGCLSSILKSLTQIFTKEIFPLVVNLLMGIAAIIWVKYHFLYSIQLFTVFILFETMQTVIYSVKLRYAQFLSAFLLMIIVSLFFAMIKFYWFNSSGECNTFNECVLGIITDGIRGGSGMGFRTKKMNEPQFFSEFAFEWMFFFIIMLILLNIINGIIVDTFQELREEANEQNETKMNICFICSLNRNLFERKGIDFDHHKECEHNVLNYLHYIYRVLQDDESELNSLDYQVLQSYNKTRTDFFPVNTCITLIEQKNED